MAGRKLDVVFIDQEKAFDLVPRKVIWWALRRKRLMEREALAIKEMCKTVETSMKIDGERSKEFEVKVDG